MGSPFPSFSLARMAEELRWRIFRSRLSKSDRKKFDEMFSTCRLYNSACANSARPIVLECIIMSIILNDFKRLTEILKESNNKNIWTQDQSNETR